MRLINLTTACVAASVAGCAVAGFGAATPVMETAGSFMAVSPDRPQGSDDPESHICPPDPAPASAAIPAFPADSVEQRSGPRQASPLRTDESVQLGGCLERDYVLDPIEIAGADEAVALAESSGSQAAIFAYGSVKKRGRLIAGWLHRSVADSPAAVKSPLTISINAWLNSSWYLPESVIVHVMYPEKAASGHLCVVRADLAGRPEALAVLNNWCMDRLDIWAH